MKFGEVFDYTRTEEAKQYIGKTGCFSDSLFLITETPMECFKGTLYKVWGKADNTKLRIQARPFDLASNCCFQFFRPILEEEEFMTNRQLLEWLAKGKGEFSYEDGSLAFCSGHYSKEDEDKPVRNDILIRRWADTEWVKPTKAIYEEDCE